MPSGSHGTSDTGSAPKVTDTSPTPAHWTNTPTCVAASGMVSRTPVRGAASVSWVADTSDSRFQPAVPSMAASVGGSIRDDGSSPIARRHDRPAGTVTVTVSPVDSGSMGGAAYSE